jgi:hypothetical protein
MQQQLVANGNSKYRRQLFGGFYDANKTRNCQVAAGSIRQLQLPVSAVTNGPNRSASHSNKTRV